VGAVLVKVAAEDFLGATGEDQFIIAAPAPASGVPSLPATSYVYEDDELALPYLYRLSRESFIPLWDQMPRNNNETTNAGATLGRVLFYDKRLSITNTHSCASCHQQALGFADAEPFSAGVVGESTQRNAMALTNVRYNVQNLHFSDDRVEGLENLTLLPIQDDLELASSLELIEGKLRGTTFYPTLFNAAFGTPVINRDRIAKALAQFLRSLIS
jgi:cytochrome c peroxidase